MLRSKQAEPDADLAQVEARLRGGAADGDAVLALLDVWAAIEAFANESEDALFDILKTAAQVAPSVGAAAALRPEQAGVGLAARDGTIVRADARFREWLGEGASEFALRRLVRQARSGKAAVALVSTAARAVIPVLAAPVAAGSKWRDVTLTLTDRAGEGDVIVIAFAPSRSKGLIMQAGKAIGLSVVEAELAATLVEEPSVESAAYRLGLNVETAREAMRRAMKRTGARNAAQLIGRIVDLGSGLADRPFLEPDAADGLLGLAPAELRLARLLADGVSAAAAAAQLGLTTETVKSYRQAIFAKLGVNRARGLRRVMSETRALQALNEASEVRWDRPSGGNLRIASAAHGRSVALIDWGPADGEPVLLFHGSSTGRLAAPAIASALGRRGYRVITPQRPGFGLTSPSPAFLDDAAEDLVAVCERLGLESAAIIARDGGVAAAMAFAGRYPSRLRRGLMINPRRPVGAVRTAVSPMSAITALLVRHPRLADPFARMLTRQTRQDLLARMLSGVYAAVEADRVCAEDPEVMQHLMADLRGLVGHSSEGFAAEHRLFAEGWRAPKDFDPSPWTFVFSGALWPGGDLDVWRPVAGGALEVIPGAGQLIQFTHAEAIADLLAAPAAGGRPAAAPRRNTGR